MRCEPRSICARMSALASEPSSPVSAATDFKTLPAELALPPASEPVVEPTSEAEAVAVLGPFYSEKGFFDHANNTKGTFYEKGPTFKKKEGPCQECPGSEHIGYPNLFPTMSHSF